MIQTPKNIRQIGGREDRIKVYMEDYVNTYLRRVQEGQEETGIAGVLVGPPQGKDPESGIFINGAVALSSADLEGGRVHMTREAWDQCDEAIGTYFSGQDLCGLFVCEGSCRRFRKTALFAAVRESFPSKEGLLFLLTEEGEEILYRITARGEERLQGYFCYFERNEAMQEYMMDNLPRRRVEWEGRGTESRGKTVEDYGSSSLEKERLRGSFPNDPVDKFRRKMEKPVQGPSRSGQGIVALCGIMALVIFVSGMGIVYQERGGVQVNDLLERLSIDPSRWQSVSAQPLETGEHYEGKPSSVKVEEIPGNVYPTEAEAEGSDSTEVGGTAEGLQEEESRNEETEREETRAEDVETGDADPAGDAMNGSVSTGETAEDALSLPVGAGVIYVVQAGDSLYSISRRFYGTEAMVSVIQEMNQLENADKIWEGQKLRLP